MGRCAVGSGEEDDDISQDEEESIREEMQNNLKEKKYGIATDSLIYWKSNCEKFPHLESAASERLFSSGRNVLGLRRLRLKPQNMELLLILEYNLKVLCRGDLKSPLKDFKPPNQSSLPSAELRGSG